MRRIWSLLAIVAVIASCSGGADPGPAGQSTTAPFAPTTAAGVDTAPPATAPPDTVAETTVPPAVPASLAIDGYRFEIAAAEAECIRLTITTPDDQVVTEEPCFSNEFPVALSSGCLLLSGGGSDGHGACDYEAPSVLYGRVGPRVGYVCVPAVYEAGFGRVRYPQIGASGLILETIEPEAQGAGWTRPYAAAGWRIDEGQFDIDVGRPIYELCEAIEPWTTGDRGPSVEVVYEADIVYRVEAPGELAGRVVRIDFGPGGYIAYQDGTRVDSRLSYLMHPVVPTLAVDGAAAELAFDAAPDLNRRWRLVITVGAGAINGQGDDVVIDPDLVTLTWEEN